MVTDQTMPDLTGEQLVQEIRRQRTNLSIILCTGFSHTMDAEKSCALDIHAFCMKLLTAQDLAGAIRQVLQP